MNHAAALEKCPIFPCIMQRSYSWLEFVKHFYRKISAIPIIIPRSDNFITYLEAREMSDQFENPHDSHHPHQADDFSSFAHDFKVLEKQTSFDEKMHFAFSNSRFFYC